MSETINRHKDIPWHMTPTNIQVYILDALRLYVKMENVDLHDGTVMVDGLKTDINRATWYLEKKKPTN